MGRCLYEQSSYFLCRYWHPILKPHLAISVHFHFLLQPSLSFRLLNTSNSQQIVELMIDLG